MSRPRSRQRVVRFDSKSGVSTGARAILDREPRTIPVVVDSGATQHMVQEGYQAKDRWAINPILIATAKEGQKIVSKSKGVYKLKLKIVKKKLN